MTDSSTPALTGLTPLHPTLPHIVVYTQPGCAQCKVMMRKLDSAAIPYICIDISDNIAAREGLISQLHCQTTPVTVVHNLFSDNSGFTSWFWPGLSPDRMRMLTRLWGAHPQTAQYPTAHTDADTDTKDVSAWAATACNPDTHDLPSMLSSETASELHVIDLTS